MNLGEWAERNWKVVPLTEEDWLYILEPFQGRRRKALAFLSRLRASGNQPMVLDWICEATMVSEINGEYRRRRARCKLYPWHSVRQVPRVHYVQITMLEEE